MGSRTNKRNVDWYFHNTAHHEAAHAVVSMALGFAVEHIWVSKRLAPKNRPDPLNGLDARVRHCPRSDFRSPNPLLAALTIAGPVADWILENPEEASKPGAVEHIAYFLWDEFPTTEFLEFFASEGDHWQMFEKVANYDEFKAIVVIAHSLLRTYWTAVEAIAQDLIRRAETSRRRIIKMGPRVVKKLFETNSGLRAPWGPDRAMTTADALKHLEGE